MRKSEQIAIRDATYVAPVIPEKRCENCRHSWFRFGGNVCQAIWIRGVLQGKVVHPLGVCDLHEPQVTTND